MWIGICPKCKKAGLRYGDGSYPAKRDLVLTGQRYCPRCKVWVVPAYQNSKTGVVSDKPVYPGMFAGEERRSGD